MSPSDPVSLLASAGCEMSGVLGKDEMAVLFGWERNLTSY